MEETHQPEEVKPTQHTLVYVGVVLSLLLIILLVSLFARYKSTQLIMPAVSTPAESEADLVQKQLEILEKNNASVEKISDDIYLEKDDELRAQQSPPEVDSVEIETQLQLLEKNN
ncbi:hypothetical protein KC902_02835 [Candidatus Kaiserbacteria bacterium]|mgnify:CR=1 FL=1|nr:hypothetical protein [Candidatus Kaiserbacteria bacterium]USN89242.1 MAG: hypothetical protein H6780_02385 [Candidatus Nomurabacteria bacterium]